jgi:hypothetical protein
MRRTILSMMIVFLLPVHVISQDIIGYNFGKRSQSQFRLGVQGQFALPVLGHFKADVGYGGIVTVEYQFNKTLFSLIASAGYVMWSGGGYDNQYSYYDGMYYTYYSEYHEDYSNIPLSIGGRFYFSDNDSRLYFQMLGGISFYSFSVNSNNSSSNPSNSQNYYWPYSKNSVSKTGVEIYPSLGFLWNLGRAYLDSQIMYSYMPEVKSDGVIGTRIGFAFPL